MLPSEIENRITQLNPWITNPEKVAWLLDRFIPAEYVQRQVEKVPLSANKALLVVGPRQSGKSTMAWHILKELFPKILYLNMEDPLLRIGLSSAIEFAAYLRSNLSFVCALFIDEIQHMDEAGLFIKGLIDSRLDIPLIVTGSSAFDLRSKTRESLAGRATRRILHPFSISEIVHHVSPKNPVAERQTLNRIFSSQLVFGSYPLIHLAANQGEKQMLLSDLVESSVLRDASDLFKIKRVDAFRKLLALLAGQIGNLLNFSELASICNIDVGTVNSYVEILEESHIIKKVRPFAGGKRREIIGSPKVFFIDNGIRNQLLNSFSNDLALRTDNGPLFENWAFSEIAKKGPLLSDVKFWRSKSMAEVDFVIEYAGRIYGLEVKYSTLKSEKVSRSSWSFMDAYDPSGFAVLNLGLEKKVVLKKRQLQFITPNSFSGWLDGIFNS